jgi:hypothetical protein
MTPVYPVYPIYRYIFTYIPLMSQPYSSYILAAMAEALPSKLRMSSLLLIPLPLSTSSMPHMLETVVNTLSDKLNIKFFVFLRLLLLFQVSHAKQHQLHQYPGSSAQACLRLEATSECFCKKFASSAALAAGGSSQKYLANTASAAFGLSAGLYLHTIILAHLPNIAIIGALLLLHLLLLPLSRDCTFTATPELRRHMKI